MQRPFFARNKKSGRCVCSTRLFCHQIARSTLLERRHLVQTYTWRGEPSTIAFTRFTLGFQALLERLWEWETLMPNVTPLPQISHFANCCTSNRLKISEYPAPEDAAMYIIRISREKQEKIFKKIYFFQNSRESLRKCRESTIIK